MADDDEELSGVGIMMVILVCAIAVVLVIINVMVMIKYQHPEDSNQWVSAKIVVVLGMTTVELIVMGLPLDVANSSGSLGCSYDWGDDTGCGYLDMTAFWYAVFFIALSFVVVWVPVSIFAYEATDETGAESGAWCTAIKSELGLLAIFGMIVGLMFAFLNKVGVPYENYRSTVDATVQVYNASMGNLFDAMGDIDGGASSSTSKEAELPATFFAYATALASWVGWFLFAVWGGIGLAALPLDLILAYAYRPVPLDASEVAEYKLQLQARTSELVDLGHELKADRADFFALAKHSWWSTRKRNSQDRITLNKLKQMVYLLETEIDDFELCSVKRQEYEPLVYVGYLFAGLVALLHSVLWIVHIVLYVLIQPPASPFLNDYLVQFDQWYPLFGALACTTFAVYMLLVTIKGAFKFGMRCFLIDLHPMAYNQTYMNDFLFNTSLFLLCSFPVAHFTTIAFANYAQYADAATIFFSIQHLTFFRIFFEHHVFEYILVVAAGISTIGLLASPRDEPASAARLKASMATYRELHPTAPLPSAREYTAHNIL